MDFQVNVQIRHPQLYAMLARDLNDRVQEEIESANRVPVTLYSGVRLQPAFASGALKDDEVTSHVEIFSHAVLQKVQEVGMKALEGVSDDADFSDDKNAFSETYQDLAAVVGAVKERCRQAALECSDLEHSAERHRAVERLSSIIEKCFDESSSEMLNPQRWEAVMEVEAQVDDVAGTIRTLEA